ncbi:MAG: hypothetical protein ABSF28_27730, partial [Terracidiphilus sp.]
NAIDRNHSGRQPDLLFPICSSPFPANALILKCLTFGGHFSQIPNNPFARLVQFSAIETHPKGCPHGSCRRERQPLEQPFRMFCNQTSHLFSYVEQPFEQPFGA